MTHELKAAILYQCEHDLDTPLMPIITELLQIIEKQEAAIEQYLNIQAEICAPLKDDCVASEDFTEALIETTLALKRLAGG